MILHAAYLYLLAGTTMVVLAMTWPMSPWVDPIGIVVFISCFVSRNTMMIYLSLFMSFFVDLLFGFPFGTMAAFYLLVAYLAVRAGRNMDIKQPLMLGLVCLIAGAISLSGWKGIQIIVQNDVSFPFSPASLLISAVVVMLLWKR